MQDQDLQSTEPDSVFNSSGARTIGTAVAFTPGSSPEGLIESWANSGLPQAEADRRSAAYREEMDSRAAILANWH